MKEQTITYIKANKSGYVDFEDINNFSILSSEIKDLSPNSENYKMGIEILVEHGKYVKEYDEIIRIFSASSLPTSFLEAVSSNLLLLIEKPNKEKLEYKKIW